GPPPLQNRNNHYRSVNRRELPNQGEIWPQSQITPNRNSPTNPVVNGSKTFTSDCTRCGQLRNYSRSCKNLGLQTWEQDILKQLAFPHESNSSALNVQTIHDLEYNRSCDYFFAGFLPEESHISRLPLWPVPPGWKSKSWREMEQSSSLTPDKSNYRPPTPPKRSPLDIRSYQDPPVCDIDDFADSDSYVPLFDIPSSRNDSIDAALNWKRLMTSENSRKKINAAMEGNSVKVENNLLEELYSFLEKRAESNKILVNSNGKQCHPLHSAVYSTNISKFSTQNNLLADRPFRVPVIVNTYKVGRLFQVKLKPGTTQADQGSDINIISDKHARDLKIKPIKLGSHMVLTMGTANGDSTQLHQYTEINICVEELWRTIQVFVRPPTTNDRSNLILGLPWLYDLDADSKIRKFQLTIGDKSKGKKCRTIQTSVFKPAVHHKLSLIPLISKNHDILDSLPVKSKLTLESSSEREESDLSADVAPSGNGNITNVMEKRSSQKTEVFISVAKIKTQAIMI
ncbi:hypothetical protein GcC1_013040, partial [Golovinomyces cichoracearum]